MWCNLITMYKAANFIKHPKVVTSLVTNDDLFSVDYIVFTKQHGNALFPDMFGTPHVY